MTHLQEKKQKINRALRLGFAGVLITVAFFLGYETKSAIVRSFTDTASGITISAGANHTIKFQTLTGVEASSDTIVVSFDTGFGVSGLDFGDVDFSHGSVTGAETEETLAAVAATGIWGASFSGQALTLTAPTNAGSGEVAASDFVIIEIGTHATTGVAGDTEITNPTSAGSYRVFVGGTFGDEGSMAVSIVADRQAVISATVSTGAGEASGGGPTPPPPPPPPGDSTPPTISGVTVSDITETSARITWTTNEPATSLVDYGGTAVYGQTSGDSLSLTHNHTVILGGLTNGTLYHFRARSADGSLNQATSTDGTFTTVFGVDLTPPVISAITVTDITGARATITWATNELSTTVLEYGTTLAYGSIASNPILTLNHSLTIIGLTSETLYHFRARSIDASGNEGFSGDQTFFTTDVTPPIISNIALSNITETSARVGWSTDEPSTSTVNYGQTPEYGSAQSEAALVTAHSVLLTGLLGGTLYHFRVVSADASGNSAASTDQTLTTAPDVTSPPNVNNFRVVSKTENSLTLAWDPPASPDYQGVKIQMGNSDYPGTPSSGTGVYDGQGTTATVSGLAFGTTYFFTAFAYDAVRNYASGALASGTTLTVAPPPLPPPPPEGVTPPPPEGVTPPPVEVPAVTVPEFERVTLDDLHFLVVGRSLELPITDSSIRALQNLAITVSIARADFAREPLRVVLNVGGSSYLLETTLHGDALEAGFALPEEIGNLPGAVIVQYEDGTEDAVEFSFLVDPYGTVYETLGGASIPVPESRVTLYAEDGGRFVWDASVFNQENPQEVGNDGAFAFLVPPGTYSLEAVKPGYRKGESPVFEVRDVIVNMNIEIFRLPPALKDVIKPEAAISENVVAVAKNIGEKTIFAQKIAKQEIKKVIDNPAVETVNQVVVAPAVVTIVVANAAAAAGVARFFVYLQFLFTQPFLLLERKKRRGWGVVYNALSKLPVDLAIVRLLDAKTNRLVSTRVTDKVGRYAFIVPVGAYRLEAAKPGFIFPTSFLRLAKEDAGFTDLYHAEEILTREDSSTLTANIPLDPIEKVEIPRKIIFRKYLRVVNSLVAVSGLILSLVSLVITPTPVFAALLALQILLYFVFRRLAVTKQPKSWGIIYDEETRHPLRLAIARIFDTAYNKLLETAVTDARGRYNFLVGRSKYYVTYEKSGYEKKQSEEIDLTKAEKPEVIAKDVGLKKSNASLSHKQDPALR